MQPKPDPTLTAQQLASTVAPGVATPARVTPVAKPAKYLLGFIPWSGRAGTVFKILVGLAATLVGFLILMAVLTFTALDTRIFKITLSGQVSDQNNAVVANAAIFLNDKELAQTDSSGKYSIGGLDIGQYSVKILTNGFNDFTQTIAINRSLLNYSVTQDFKLTASGVGDLKLKLTGAASTYRFLDDKITLDGKAYRIATDGTLLVKGTPTTQESILEFTSINFVDFERKFSIKAGENDLGEVKLQSAGDIVGSIMSWLKEDVVKDVQITVEGVDPKFVSMDTTAASFRIKDLEVGKQYKLRSEATGYLTRDYTLKIAQGENQIFNFRIVETGLVPFMRKITTTIGTYPEIFVSELDGQNQKQLTAGDIQAYNEFIQQDVVYFGSTRDNVYSQAGSQAMLAYAINTVGGNLQRISNPNSTYGQIALNFHAKLMTNIIPPTDYSKPSDRILQVMGIEGTNPIQIEYAVKGKYSSSILSDNGKKVFYVLQESAGTRDGLYAADTNGQNKVKVSSRKNIIIYDASSDGSRIIYEGQNPVTKLQDFYMYDLNTSQETVIKTSFAGSQYQFVEGSTTKIIFQEYRDGGSNVYLLDTTNSSDQPLTKFSGTEGVDTIYQQAGYVVYQTNKGMYLLDVTEPKLGKLVTSSFSRYNGGNV